MGVYILDAQKICRIVTFAAQQQLIFKEDRQAWAERFQTANYESEAEQEGIALTPELRFTPQFAAPDEIMQLCRMLADNSDRCSNWQNSDEVKLLRYIYAAANQQHKAALQLAKETEIANKKRWLALGGAWIQANAAHYDFAIVGRLLQDVSDGMTDY